MTDLSNHTTDSAEPTFARRLLAVGCLMPLLNAASALALGLLVVYSDADDYPVLAGILSAANVGGWFWWMAGSAAAVRTAIRRWMTASAPHPGFRLAGLMSLGVAFGWVGVLCLLAYGMLG